jgi:hypothetical protein
MVEWEHDLEATLAMLPPPVVDYIAYELELAQKYLPRFYKKGLRLRGVNRFDEGKGLQAIFTFDDGSGSYTLAAMKGSVLDWDSA